MATVPKIPLFKPDETLKFTQHLEVGPGRLQALFTAWSDKLTGEEVCQLKDYLVKEWGRTKAITEPTDFGSMCSGTDIPAAVCEQWWLWAGQWTGHDFEYKHRFSSELDAKKRAFINVMHPNVGHIFGNLKDLSHRSGEVWDLKRRDLVRVPVCRILTAGFPCLDVSGLNPHSRTLRNRQCISQVALRTGGVFAGIVEYIKAMICRTSPPEVIIFENVMGLKNPPKDDPNGPSNLDIVGLMLSGLGYRLHAWHLSPRMFGVPQCRQRVWMTAIRTSNMEGVLADFSESSEILAELMSRITGFPESKLVKYLVNSRQDCE